MKITRADLCLYIPLCDSGPFAENIIDYAAVLEAFRQVGYRGMYALECPGIQTMEEADRILDRIIAG